MIVLNERVKAFEILFEALQSTNSRLEKEDTVKVFLNVNPELKEDWTYILETLDGKHPIGWTYRGSVMRHRPATDLIHNRSIKDLIRICENAKDKTQTTIALIEAEIGPYGDFIKPIVNRTLRLGIGKSLLDKSNITPMLAKKYEGGILYSDYIVTEKLDGNRCIASFNKDTCKWEFYSRSGKPMKVDFDLLQLNPDYIYDGEIMSEEQTLLSLKRYNSIVTDTDFEADTKDAQLLFNRTSGLINSHEKSKKGLVYNIFDIITNDPYFQRRQILDSETEGVDLGGDIRILKPLYLGSDCEVMNELLGRITQMGGEGIMLNTINGRYEHKRSGELLKYKQVQFMDMKVVSVCGGTGKYEGLVGSLNCSLTTADGKNIICNVGSGLSDEQRFEWARELRKIVGKIVQIGYHEMTQSEENIGTNIYSLRFPRLIKIRSDKTDTSEY